MDDDFERRRLEERLDRIETCLQQIRLLVIVLIGLVVIGFWDITKVLSSTFSFVVIGILILGVGYGLVWLLWGAMRLKSGRDDAAIRNAILSDFRKPDREQNDAKPEN